MLQLYLSQPEHRIAWFFNVESDHTNTIGDAKILHEILPKLSEETPEFILKVIYDSVIQTYTEHQLPYIESTLESVSEFDLGFHMMNEMLVVIILSELWNVNPYDQPHVEGYKSLIRKAL
jgi:glucose-6-phosphate isomerase